MMNKKGRTLFFRNLFLSDQNKENNEWFHQATLHLASSFSTQGLPISICRSKFSLSEDLILEDMAELDRKLREEKDINMVVLTLIESTLPKTRALCRWIRERSDAYLVVGGIMPTLSPEFVIELVPEAQLIIRGEGEHILPKIHKILGGKGVSEKLPLEALDELKKLKGVFFRNGDVSLKSDDFSINLIDDLDSINIDFSLLGKENVSDGISLSTSRGCRNGCFFCTIPSKGKYRSRSVGNIANLLERYHERLAQIFGGTKNIPSSSLKISFNDDDFLSDRKRAIDFFHHFRKTPFKINFIQTAINSLFIKDASGSEIIDDELIEAMDPKLFSEASDAGGAYSIYIGTENFVDEELARLGKNCTYQKIERAIEALSRRGLVQAHHLIFSNVHTTPADILENLVRISYLKTRYKKYFNLLLPVIPNLVSMYPSASYSMLAKNNLLHNLKVSTWLLSENNPETRYPLIEKDLPQDELARALADMSSSLFSKEDYREGPIVNVMTFLLRHLESMRLRDPADERAVKLGKTIKQYADYRAMIRSMLPINLRKEVFAKEKRNVQLMLTRRCQLRCTYCPVPKKDEDMDILTLRKAIDLLFASKENDLRVDFTGGEPLLRFDLLKEGIEYSLALAKERGKKVSFYIVTNSLLLSEEVADFLDGKRVLLELSIDGDERAHNECKVPLEQGINPYLVATKNISYLLKKDVRRFVVLVVNPKNCGQLYENFSHIISLGLPNIEINYALGNTWDEESQRTFFAQLQKIMDDYSSELINGQIVIGNFGKRAEPSILNSELMIDSDGTIRLLNEFLFRSKNQQEPPFAFGSVSDHKDLSELYVDRFMVYYSLVRQFCENDESIRKILDNNISMGRLCERFFLEQLRKLNYARKTKGAV